MNSRPAPYKSPVSGREWDCFIPSAASLPTGIGKNELIIDISDVREHMGFPKRYRTGIATLTRGMKRFVVGPPPDHVPSCMSDLYWYMSLAGDRLVKGWYATCFLLTVHPWEGGNGRTAREFYRRYTASNEDRNSLRGRLRGALPKFQPPRNLYPA
ncbi:Fic family protein [Salinibacter ruber]|uniref:Fic family protein n=2 Tax=Salinibacter ruber TaxID=146919 RepID=UPI003C6E2E4A